MTEQKNALMVMVNEKKETLRSLFPSYMKDINYDVFLKRSLLSIFENKDLVKISKTQVGAHSLYMCLVHASETGLQIGGLHPHAYIVPFGEEAVMIPTAAGYRFIVRVENPVLIDYIQKAVYDGDNCHIDAMTGDIKHEIAITEAKRKLIGIYAVFVELNGTRHADYISRGEIESIRDKWSKQPKGKAWENSFEAMAMNKAAKHFLKPYADQKEALNRVLVLDNDDGDPVRDNRPITDRVGDALDGVIDAEFEPETPEKKEPETAATGAGQGPEKKGKAPF